jgi:hypothetical protein
MRAARRNSPEIGEFDISEGLSSITPDPAKPGCNVTSDYTHARPHTVFGLTRHAGVQRVTPVDRDLVNLAGDDDPGRLRIAAAALRGSGRRGSGSRGSGRRGSGRRRPGRGQGLREARTVGGPDQLRNGGRSDDDDPRTAGQGRADAPTDPTVRVIPAVLDSTTAG